MRLAVVAVALAGTACSARAMAVRSMRDALARGEVVYAREDDPDLVREASPFTLKTIESLLEESPRDRALLEAAAAGFTRYTYAFVQQDADFAEDRDLARARELRVRARRLYLRARDYGLRRLEADLPGFRARLARDTENVLARTRPRDASALYWTAFAWSGALSVARDDPELTAEQALVESMMRRALALDEDLEGGAVHDFFIAWEAGHRAAGGSLDAARGHLERSLAISGGRRAAPLVVFAETSCVARQDRAEFGRLLERALAIDTDRDHERRLENLVHQARARWLRARSDELFVE